MQVSSGFLELPEWELGEGPDQEPGGTWNSAGPAQPWAQPSPGFVPSSYSPAPRHPLPHPVPIFGVRHLCTYSGCVRGCE